VGNKADVQSKRQVDRTEAQAFADDNGPVLTLTTAVAVAVS
jgi:hypothetical protein